MSIGGKVFSAALGIVAAMALVTLISVQLYATGVRAPGK